MCNIYIMHFDCKGTAFCLNPFWKAPYLKLECHLRALRIIALPFVSMDRHNINYKYYRAENIKLFYGLKFFLNIKAATAPYTTNTENNKQAKIFFRNSVQFSMFHAVQHRAIFFDCFKRLFRYNNTACLVYCLFEHGCFIACKAYILSDITWQLYVLRDTTKGNSLLWEFAVREWTSNLADLIIFANNIKINLKELGFDNADWIFQA